MGQNNRRLTSKPLYASFFLLLSFAILGWAPPAVALDPIPAESGFNGFLRLGGGYMNYKSNMVSGNKFDDITDQTITSINDGPKSNDTGVPTIDFGLNYTFGSTRTQINLGSTLEDIARLENNQQLAVKQELPDKSLLQLGVLFSTFPTEVWKDPYLENTPREDTDRTSKGLKFAFDKILGSNFEFIYTFRRIEIDDEQSGFSRGLTAAQRQSLVREGDNHKADLRYRFNIDNRHFIEPGLIYFEEDRDGRAMSNDGFEGQLTYLYMGDIINFVLTGAIGKADYKEGNPLYNNRTEEDDRYLAGAQIYYKNPFGWKPFENGTVFLFLTGSYYKEDANIDFYDAEVSIVNAGIMVRF